MIHEVPASSHESELLLARVTIYDQNFKDGNNKRLIKFYRYMYSTSFIWMQTWILQSNIWEI